MCFICAKYGVDNTTVFKCSYPNCGHFYHLPCVFADKFTTRVPIIYSINKNNTSNNTTHTHTHTKSTHTHKHHANAFHCPRHKCHNSKCADKAMRIASSSSLMKCFRCPNCYHSKCLPIKYAKLNSRLIVCGAHFKVIKFNS